MRGLCANSYRSAMIASTSAAEASPSAMTESAIFSIVNGLSSLTSPSIPAGCTTCICTGSKPAIQQKPREARPNMRIASVPLDHSSIQFDVAAEGEGLGMTEMPREVDVLDDQRAARLQPALHPHNRARRIGEMSQQESRIDNVKFNLERARNDVRLIERDVFEAESRRLLSRQVQLDFVQVDADDTSRRSHPPRQLERHISSAAPRVEARHSRTRR